MTKKDPTMPRMTIRDLMKTFEKAPNLDAEVECSVDVSDDVEEDFDARVFGWNLREVIMHQGPHDIGSAIMLFDVQSVNDPAVRVIKRIDSMDRSPNETAEEYVKRLRKRASALAKAARDV